MSIDASHIARFTEAGLLILSSLSTGEKHGYALMEDIGEAHGVRLGPGTLYTALARLEDRGLIEAMESGGRRRPYRLTEPGRSFLQEQLTHLHRFATSGLARLADS